MEEHKDTIVDEFLKDLGNDQIFFAEADFMPLFLLVEWVGYFGKDETVAGYALPSFLYKDGKKVKWWFDFDRYHRAAELMVEGYFDGSITRERYDAGFRKMQDRVNERYETYYQKRDTAGESDLLEMLRGAHEELIDIGNRTLCIDTIDNAVIERTLAKAGMKADFDRVSELSGLIEFLSFDTKNKQEILRRREDGSLDQLQHVFANYTYVPSFEEVREKVIALDPAAIQEEIRKQEEEIAHNKEAKRRKGESLPETDRAVLAFVDWVSELRDERKVLINKCDVLLHNLVADLYRLWELTEELVPVSLVYDVLKGKEHARALEGTLRERLTRTSILYFGADGYREDVSLGATDIAPIEKRYLELNKSKEASVLKGQPACKGQATGIARIITSASEFGNLAEGEILVTGMTRPEFVPLMKIAAAIVTDEGGITSHAAIVSRELKKPCVIGTKIATKTIQDGDWIEVDANTGVVKILDHA